MDVSGIIGVPVGKLAEILSAHHFGKADDGVERRAQLMAHIREEGGLCLARHFGARLGEGELGIGFLQVDPLFGELRAFCKKRLVLVR